MPRLMDRRLPLRFIPPSRFRPIVLAAATIAAAGFADAEAPTTPVEAVSDLASLREGVFTTAPAADDQGGASPGGPIFYDLAKRVDVPALGRDVVYDELHEGSPDGKIVRQTLYVLKLEPDAGQITMTAYSFGDSAAMAGAYANPAPLATLNPPDLRPQSPGCAINWRKTAEGFAGDFEPGCKAAPHPAGTAKPDPAVTVSKTTLMERIDGGPTAFRRVR